MKLTKKQQAALATSYEIVDVTELRELRAKAKLTELPPRSTDPLHPPVGFTLGRGVLLLVALHALAGLAVSLWVYLRNR